MASKKTAGKKLALTLSYAGTEYVAHPASRSPEGIADAILSLNLPTIKTGGIFSLTDSSKSVTRAVMARQLRFIVRNRIRALIFSKLLA